MIRKETVHRHHWDTEVCIFQGQSRPELVRQIQRARRFLQRRPEASLKDLAFTLNSELRDESVRLAVVASSGSDLEQKLGYAINRLLDPKCRKIREISGVYFFEDPLGREGATAFLFPGEGSQYLNMLADLCLYLPEVRLRFDLVDRAFAGHARGILPSQIIFPPTRGSDPADRERNERLLWNMDTGAEAVFTASQALYALLSRLGVRPEAILGHSTGEYSALLAAGAVEVESETRLIEHILALNRIYERLASQQKIPLRVLLSVGNVEADHIAAIVEQSNGSIYLAMDNCPHQTVVCGTEEAIAGAIEQLRGRGAICERLPFNRAYHTPLFEQFSEPLRDFFARLRIVPPKIKLYSCTTARPYPQNPEEIRELAVAQWARPVRFRETIEAMHADGARIFLEVGPRAILTGFVNDILRGKSYLAVASNVPHRTGITQLNHVVALLAAHAIPLNLDYLYELRAARLVSLDDPAAEGTKKTRDTGGINLALGLPLLRLVKETTADPSQLSTSTAATLSENGSERSPGPRRRAAEEALRRPTAAQPVELQFSFPPENTSYGNNHHANVKDHRAAAMDEYLKTMELFLQSQHSIMKAYFSNGVSEVMAVSPEGVEEPQAVANPASSVYFGRTNVREQSLQSPALPDESSTAPTVDASTDSAAMVSQIQRSPEQVFQLGAQGASRQLLLIVSDKTGYPVEMLDTTLKLEADLGVDSIKRVEILGALQRATGLIQSRDLERLSGYKTLQEIINFLDAETSRRQSGALEVGEGSHIASPSPPSRPDDDSEAAAIATLSNLSFPFVGDISSFVPGKEVVVTRLIRVDDDLFLRDHTLGGTISVADSDLTALPIIPLTMSLEMLAESAALLMDGKLVVGMKDIRAYHWLTLESANLTLRLTAKRQSRPAENEVKVKLSEVADASCANRAADELMLEGTVVFGDSYPEPPLPTEFSLQDRRPSAWTPERLYTEGMFNGPSFQGVASVDRCGKDGAEATLVALPGDQLFRFIPKPNFLTDPVLLDAAGQVVGFWTAERLETGFVIFPFGIKELNLYGSKLRQGEHAKCRARIILTDNDQVQSDLDIIGRDGRQLMQIRGWKDKRFNLSRALARFVLSPRDNMLSTPWPQPVEQFPAAEAFFCCRLDEFANDLLSASAAIWERVLAYLVLGRKERDVWLGLKGPQKRRHEWLRGRLAAKDAVRLYLKKHYGIELLPADIEITSDENGRPTAGGSWTKQIESVLLLSLAHSGRVAVAVVGKDNGYRSVGIDIESVNRTIEGLEDIAFTPEERNLLSAMADTHRRQWSLRLWCAKEAVAKALGRGMIGGPQCFVARELDVRTGVVKVAVRGELVKEFPELVGTCLTAYTAQEGELVAASSFLEK